MPDTTSPWLGHTIAVAMCADAPGQRTLLGDGRGLYDRRVSTTVGGCWAGGGTLLSRAITTRPSDIRLQKGGWRVVFEGVSILRYTTIINTYLVISIIISYILARRDRNRRNKT